MLLLSGDMSFLRRSRDLVLILLSSCPPLTILHSHPGHPTSITHLLFLELVADLHRDIEEFGDASIQAYGFAFVEVVLSVVGGYAFLGA